MLRDPEFGPLRVRAFGTYALRVADPASFIREIVGTDGHFTTDEVSDQLRNILVARFTDALAESGIPVLDMAANQDELGEKLAERVRDDLETYGLELRTLLVENISLPPQVEEALDKRTSMGVIGDMTAFTQYQAAEAIGDAAENPGAGGLAAGLGFAMANQMGQTLNPQQPQQPPATGSTPSGPPPLPTEPKFYAGIDGQRAGPFDASQLREHVQAGRISADTLVWTEGMAEWKAAKDVTAVAKLLGTVPPPLPPS